MRAGAEPVDSGRLRVLGGDRRRRGPPAGIRHSPALQRAAGGALAQGFSTWLRRPFRVGRARIIVAGARGQASMWLPIARFPLPWVFLLSFSARLAVDVSFMPVLRAVRGASTRRVIVGFPASTCSREAASDVANVLRGDERTARKVGRDATRRRSQSSRIVAPLSASRPGADCAPTLADKKKRATARFPAPRDIPAQLSEQPVVSWRMSFSVFALRASVSALARASQISRRSSTRFSHAPLCSGMVYSPNSAWRIRRLPSCISAMSSPATRA